MSTDKMLSIRGAGDASPHMLFVGQSGSGKSTLAHHAASMARENGDGVIVFNPILGVQWDCDYCTHDQDDFLTTFNESRGCLCIIDEAGTEIGQHNEQMIKCAVQGRHKGHAVIFITQRATMINPSIRVNCSRLFLFRTSAPDCDLICKEYIDEDLRNAPKLTRGEFYYCQAMQSAELYKLEIEKND